uniref:Ubiquitin-like protein ATG12 n=1 Tax=Leptobrachium leishanense TaxID=445787 RepID=A0A8C5Q9Z9_9ANUR
AGAQTEWIGAFRIGSLSLRDTDLTLYAIQVQLKERRPQEWKQGSSPTNGTERGNADTATEEQLPGPAISPPTEEAVCETKRKIDILLKAVGDTPIMKTKKWALERTRTVQGLMDFIKKYLKFDSSEQMFIYVNQSFAPSPDQEVGTLYECFGSDGKLVLHYCKSQAWG